MKLPLKYTETMKALLGEEYDAYLASFDEERFYGLRVNLHNQFPMKTGN